MINLPPSSPIKLYALGTHSDWTHNGGAWGLPGHHRIAGLTYSAGIRRLYWRTHAGGQAMYPSRCCRVYNGSVYRNPNFKGLGTLPKSYFSYFQHLDYSQWDQVTDMAEIGTQAGLEVCHWYTVYEDDHGGHLSSAFLDDHPEWRCTLRSGEQINGSLDFWYPEVREYKLSILSELLEKPTSRILLDFVRRNGTPSSDAAGHYRYGYNPEIVADFKKQTGLDAFKIEPGDKEWTAWIHYNSQPLTEFFRKASKLVKSKGLPLDILVWNVNPLSWQALDIRTIAREGWIDSVHTASHRYAFSEEDIRTQYQTLSNALGEDIPIPIIPSISAYNQLPARAIDQCTEAALNTGAKAISLHECNHIVECPLGDRLRAWHYGKPHSQRTVYAQKTNQNPIKYTGFIRCHDYDDTPCSQETSFTTRYTSDELIIEVTCNERNPNKLLPVPQIGKDNYNANQLGARTFNPYESIQLLLDPTDQHEDYLNFIIDPSGPTTQGSRLEEKEPGNWSGNALIRNNCWTATFRIPWSSLGILPQSGTQLGLQIFRSQNNPRELAAWFCTTGRRINPIDFGHLVLE